MSLQQVDIHATFDRQIVSLSDLFVFCAEFLVFRTICFSFSPSLAQYCPDWEMSVARAVSVSVWESVSVAISVAMRHRKLDNTRQTDDANTQVYE